MATFHSRYLLYIEPDIAKVVTALRSPASL
jgi:hypothetical protein